jgi:hypothetical protein
MTRWRGTNSVGITLWTQAGSSKQQQAASSMRSTYAHWSWPCKRTRRREAIQVVITTQWTNGCDARTSALATWKLMETKFMEMTRCSEFVTADTEYISVFLKRCPLFRLDLLLLLVMTVVLHRSKSRPPALTTDWSYFLRIVLTWIAEVIEEVAIWPQRAQLHSSFRTQSWRLKAVIGVCQRAFHCIFWSSTSHCIAQPPWVITKLR